MTNEVRPSPNPMSDCFLLDFSMATGAGERGGGEGEESVHGSMEQDEERTDIPSELD